MTDTYSLRAFAIECDGGPHCKASPHLHGCFADKGDCDHRDEHGPRHTGFGDCACFKCWPPEPEFPLADRGQPLGLWRSLWAVIGGVRLYG